MRALVIVVLAALVVGCTSGKPTGSDPAQRTTPTPGATVPSTPAPSTTPRLGDFTALPPGTYLVDYLPQAHITVTVASGWTNFQGWAILKGEARVARRKPDSASSWPTTSTPTHATGKEHSSTHPPDPA